MNIFNGFNRKQVQSEIELKITLSKLQLLASSMENDTDKASDLKYWQENIDNLQAITIKNVYYLTFVKESYYTLYKLYLKKHHVDL